MPTCCNCGQLVETGRVFCPYCYAPLRSMKPLSRQVMPLITLAALLAALVRLIELVIAIWLRSV